MDRYVDANGIRNHVIDHGGDGPVLVLAPGLTSNAHVFDGLVAAGLAESSRVLAFDLRARGETDRPDSGYDLDDHAADVVAVLDVLGFDEFIMGGHSYGAMLALWMAVDLPDRVTACVALDPPVDMGEQVRAQIQPAVDRLHQIQPSLDAYIEFAKNMPYYAGWWDALIEPYFRADVEYVPGGVRPIPRPHLIEAVLDGCMKVDWGKTQASVSQPTLLIRATRPYGPPGAPALLPRGDADLIMSRLSDATMVEIEANHMTMLFGDPANQTVDAILEFAKGL